MVRVARNVLLVVPLLFALIVFLQPREGRALPLFARKYGLQCTSCHFAFPRLNKFGMDFRQRGYRMPGDKGESPWELKEFPISLVGNVGYNYTRVSTMTPTGTWADTATSAFVQNTVEFHMAGTLGPNFTFHFDNNFAGVNGPLNSGQAFVQFDDVVKDGVLNVKGGIYDAEIPYLSDSRRTTLSHYVMPVTLPGAGVELNGTKTGWTYAAGLSNSSRTFSNKSGDHTLNNFENPYVWVMRDIGNHEITARWYGDHQDPRKPDVTSSMHNQFDVSAFLNFDKAQVIPGYTYEKFADLPAVGVDQSVQSALLEGIVKFGGDAKWLGSARYELRHTAKTDFNPVSDLNAETLGLAYYVNPNARLAGEWTHAADNVGGPRTVTYDVYVFVGY
jgi:hypothetical protein